MRSVISWLVILALLSASALAQGEKPPGVVIDHISAKRGIYIGSPSIAILPDGSYLASHDEFGPKSQYHGEAVTRVFRSGDRGETWEEISKIDGCLWATLFVYRDALYLWGTNREYGDMLIRRSSDWGKTWTKPVDGETGLLIKGNFHCAPVPVVVHGGRIWRAWEEATPGKKWGENFKACVMSAAEDADLLKAKSWTRTNTIARDPAWLGGKFGGWLEGNAVVTPEGKVVDILRVDDRPEGETAAIVRISDDGTKATFDAEKDFIHFPGGSKKFSIRFDPASKRYWSLSNFIPPEFRGPTPAGTRNTLALISSPDLRNWTVVATILQHKDRAKHAFQYVDWLFDGKDIIAASRTAYDDGEGGAHSAHDANYLTFHRISDFRNMGEGK